MVLPGSLGAFAYEFGLVWNRYVGRKKVPVKDVVQDYKKQRAELKRECKRLKREGKMKEYEEKRKLFLTLEIKEEKCDGC